MTGLSHSLRIAEHRAAAFVGAGGKTSAMFQVARELAPVLVTTSTHLLNGQGMLADRHLFWEPEDSIPDLSGLAAHGITLVTGRLDPVKNRFLGSTSDQLQILNQVANSQRLPILVEADGARQRSIKAPAEHEPAIPDFVDLVVVVAGLTGLGRPVDAEYVHRPEIFAELSGLKTGEIITTAALARALTHPAGGIKNIPPGARRVALLNQAYTPVLQAQGQELARLLLPVFDSVLVAALQPPPGNVLATYERIAGVVLAAGAASRFGRTKQLLDYHGRPFVRASAEVALQAGLSPVIVVTGAEAEAVASACSGLPVSVVYNPIWNSGQSSSIQAGLGALPSNIGGAVFLLADQPQITVELLRALTDHHSQELNPVLAPYIFDRRANPVLFDRITFGDLLTISGDSGGRAIFSKFSPHYLNWFDRRLLLDVDTPEDYQKLIGRDSNAEADE